MPLKQPSSLTERTLVLAAGASVYLLILATFAYLIAFVLDLPVPRTLNRMPETCGELAQSWAIAINAGLLGLFGVQHSIMARTWFKRWLIRSVHPGLERSAYCLATCIVLGCLFAFWTPIQGVVWKVESSAVGWLLRGLAAAGFGLVFLASCLLNHFELFGLARPLRVFRQQPEPQICFREPGLYRWMRHPIYTGMLFAVWSTPNMTYGHLLFAVLSSAYIMVGSRLEEIDLADTLGKPYRDYQERVGRFFPRLLGRS